MTPPPADIPPPDPAALPAHQERSSGSRGSSSDDEPTRVTGMDGAPPVPAQTVPLGPSIEGFVLKEELHRGGQGIVYRALQIGTKRNVALKVLLEGPYAGETTRRRFEREIELAASLRHPNIVTILDSGVSLGRYYFAMEYIDGLRLDRYIAQQRPTLDEALILFEKVCLAVNFAHQRGVIHRDLKPPNILVDREGEPRILDFGLAKPVHPLGAGESTVQVLSVSGQLLGTVAYMSPEQAVGSQDVDVRSDVYSLGVIFYEALVGRPPYSVDGPLGEILTRIARDDPPNPRSQTGCLCSGYRVDDETATILLKALEKEPQRRYQTAGELARDVRRRLEGEPIEAKRASGLYMLKKTLRRYRLQAGAAGIILLMLLGFLITLAVLWSGERDARRLADVNAKQAQQAVERRDDALRIAEQRRTEAVLAEENLRRALGRQHIQRGDLALERHDLGEARDSYWKAMEVVPGPAATWALRRYYLQTSDNGAILATFEPRSPTKLSPNGRLAAVCSGPESISVRPLEPGAPSGWVATPGPITILDVADDGSLAAAGAGWVRAWAPGALQPSLVVQLASNERPTSLYVFGGGEGALLVSERRVRICGGAFGENGQGTLLQGMPIGRADFAPGPRLLAIPTSAGVELVSVSDGGKLQTAVVWTGAAPARAVRFDGDELLAVLADAVYVSTVADIADGRWTRFIDAAPEWDLFDLKHGVGVIVFATGDGRMGVYRSGKLVATWRYAGQRLEQLRLSVEDKSTVTLDDRGTVTRWVPPEQVEERRLLHEGAPTTWATAGDGSTILMAVGRGQVIAYGPDHAAQPRTVLRPRLLSLGDEGISLAVDEHGQRAVIRDRATLRLVDLDTLTTHLLPWSYSALSVPDKVGLSGDGSLVALLVRSPTGDQQQIAFSPWPFHGAASVTDEQVPSPVDFVGAIVRDMAFKPGSHELLVVRSNGQLLLLNPDRAAPPAGNVTGGEVAPTATMPAAPVSPLTPWMQLDVPGTTVAFNRTGEYLAVACEDGVVRLISVTHREVRLRIPIEKPISALAFNPRDDILLVRTADGIVRLFDPSNGESLAAWHVPARTDHPLAAWLGDSTDALVLGFEGGVYEYRFAEADAVIERNRAYAAEERVSRFLGEADFASAWTAAEALRTLDSRRGEWAEVASLETALRRPTAHVDASWTATVLAGAPAATYLRLGDAAYDGERFDLAREWLRRGTELADGDADALTLWHSAACDYLADDYDRAARELAAALARPDFDPTRAATAALQRVAALVLGGHMAEARQAAQRIGDLDPRGHYSDVVATTYASVIARVITGIERESAAATAVDSLLGTFGERPLLFRDDEHFFGGEMARQHGDFQQAAMKYQRCIDLARDEWPSNWAHYRLAHLKDKMDKQAAAASKPAHAQAAPSPRR